MSPQNTFPNGVFLGAARTEVVVDLAELCSVGSDQRQCDAYLWCRRGVVMVTRSQKELAGIEGGIDEEVFLFPGCARVDVATSNDGQGPANTPPV